MSSALYAEALRDRLASGWKPNWSEIEDLMNDDMDHTDLRRQVIAMGSIQPNVTNTVADWACMPLMLDRGYYGLYTRSLWGLSRMAAGSLCTLAKGYAERGNWLMIPKCASGTAWGIIILIAGLAFRLVSVDGPDLSGALAMISRSLGNDTATA